MEKGAWNEGVNNVNKIGLSTVEVERKIALYIGSKYKLYKRLFGLFGSFIVKVRNC